MSLINNKYVPDEGPLTANLVLVGEAPGETEERDGKPFIGESGNLLIGVLGRAGRNRESVRLANLCHYRPHGNKFENLVGTPELSAGIEELRTYLATYRPNCVVALGAQPLNVLTGKNGIHAWRGSILECILPGCEGIKVIPTYHPAFILRNRESYPIFDFDVKRAASDSGFADLRLPSYEMVIDPKGPAFEEAVQELCNADRISVDIETTKPSAKNPLHLLCVGFAPSPDRAFCFPTRLSPEFEIGLSRILASPARKVFHFGYFDTAVLKLKGFETYNWEWDTFIGQHILNPEMPRSLDFLTSLYTRMPYYKASGRSEIPGDNKAWSSKADKYKLYEYNCRDVIATIAIQKEQELELALESKQMQYLFRFDMDQAEMQCEIGEYGLLVDMQRRERFRKALLARWFKLQAMLNVLVGKTCNVKSPKLKDILYGDLKLPTRRKRGKDGKPGTVTTDEDAIISLITYCEDYIQSLKREDVIKDWRLKLIVCKAILEIRGIRQLLSVYILNKISEDNRIRSTYKLGPETGRWACEKFVDDTGNNAQTFPRGYVEVPDELLDEAETLMTELDEEVEEEGAMV